MYANGKKMYIACVVITPPFYNINSFFQNVRSLIKFSNFCTLHDTFVIVVMFLTENNQMNPDSIFFFKNIRMKIFCYNSVICIIPVPHLWTDYSWWFWILDHQNWFIVWILPLMVVLFWRLQTFEKLQSCTNLYQLQWINRIIICIPIF